jgi:hypothetical protein
VVDVKSQKKAGAGATMMSFASQVKLAPVKRAPVPPVAAAVAPQLFCGYCKNKGKSEEEYTSHGLREFKDIKDSAYTCPEILKIKCTLCERCDRYPFGHYKSQCPHIADSDTIPGTPAVAPSAPAVERVVAKVAPATPATPATAPRPVLRKQGQRSFGYLLLHDGHRALTALKSTKYHYYEYGTKISRLLESQETPRIFPRNHLLAPKKLVVDMNGIVGMNAGQYVIPGGLLEAESIRGDILNKWFNATGCRIMEVKSESGDSSFVFANGGYVAQSTSLDTRRQEQGKDPVFFFCIQFHPKDLDLIEEAVNSVLQSSNRASLRSKVLSAFSDEEHPNLALLPRLEDFKVMTDELERVKIVTASDSSDDNSYRAHFRDPVQQSWFFEALERNIKPVRYFPPPTWNEVPDEDF